MPVTTYPAAHSADVTTFQTDASTLDVLEKCSPTERKIVKQLIQSSFLPDDFPHKIAGSPNGFVNAAIQAYNRHLHLSIRPEDVWISILTQFSLYVNADAEELRSKFVAHKGKKTLVIKDFGSIHTSDFGIFASCMTKELEKNVLDEDLRQWIMPSFTTTTNTDQVVAAVVMMGTLIKYFSYKWVLACGLPSVTLFGERSDWEDILMRLEKLLVFGEGARQWYDLLKPVIRRFVKTFDEPETEETKEFWQKIAHHHGGGSGPRYYSGWITAFCFWDADGKSLALPQSQISELDREEEELVALLAKQSLNSPLDLRSEPSEVKIVRNKRNRFSPHCEFDGVLYHHIDSNDVPPGFVSVPVTIDDNGMVYKTTVIAGSVAYRVESAGAEVRGRVAGQRDALRPEVGWWMFETENMERRKTKRGRIRRSCWWRVFPASLRLMARKKMEDR